MYFDLCIDRIQVPLKGEEEALHSGRRLAIILRKEVICMLITVTLHVFGYTITIKMQKKSNNRHSAK